jgi:hypothetical protein
MPPLSVSIGVNPWLKSLRLIREISVLSCSVREAGSVVWQKPFQDLVARDGLLFQYLVAFGNSMPIG